MLACPKCGALWSSPAGLKWTSEKPTKEGWYWYLQSPNGRKPEVVQVVKNGTVWHAGMDSYTDLENMNGQWAGPIPEPEEAKADTGTGGGKGVNSNE